MNELKVFEYGHIIISKTPKVTGKGQVYFINAFLGRTEKCPA